MYIIYEPKGRALEYSPLAANLYTGCVHGCKYCFSPGALRKTPAEFHQNVQPRKDILKNLERDCIDLEGDPRQILLCFTCDPYQPSVLEERVCDKPDTVLPPIGIEDVTREALLILERYRMNVTVLTKGGTRAVRDFDILQRNGWWFGTSLSFSWNGSLREWEPQPSADVTDRSEAIHQAKCRGIHTWVSVEPVIKPEEALTVIQILRGDVDFWKIGKLNHMPEIEKTIDWKNFLLNVEKILKGKSFYIKKDLAEYRNGK